MTPKPWYKSKTLYFNALTGVVFIATYFFGYQPNDVVTNNLISIVTNPLFLVAGNLVVRYFTKQPITFSNLIPNGTEMPQ